MKKHFAFLLTAALFLQTTPVLAAGNITAFTDYSKNLGYGQLSTHWAKTNIETLLNHDGINGYPEGDFRANKEISAAELIAIILNVTENADDLTGDSWAEKIMNRAYALEICKETEIPLTDANKPISREKMALILVNCAEKLNQEDTSALTLIDHTTIADLNQANILYQNAIVKAYSMGLLAGTGLNYAPKSSTTRAEATAIVNRLMGYVERVDAKKAEAERRALGEDTVSNPNDIVVTPDILPSSTTPSEDNSNSSHEILDSIKSGTYDSEVKKNVTSEGFITAEDYGRDNWRGEVALSGAVGVVNDPAAEPSLFGG